MYGKVLIMLVCIRTVAIEQATTDCQVNNTIIHESRKVVKNRECLGAFRCQVDAKWMWGSLVPRLIAMRESIVSSAGTGSVHHLFGWV